MKFLKNIFRRTQEPPEGTTQEENSTQEPQYPTNESVSEIDIDPNDFDQLQDVVDAQEIYERAAEYGRAKTFVEQNKWRLPVAQIGIYGGHTLSALTMLGFALLASWKWTGVSDNPNMENYLIAGVSAVVLLLMTLLVETIKVNGEASMFDAWAFGRKFPISRKIRVMATILISLGVSSGGSYLFGLYYTDNSAQINAQNQALASQTTNTFRSDSLRLENNYTARKAQLEKDIDFYGAISKDNPFLIRVKWKGGQQFLKEDWKLSPAGRQTVTDKETELAALIADFPTNLKNLRNEHTGDIQVIQRKLSTELQTDASKAQVFGIYAIIIATIVEILSLVCHFLKADFMKRARSEGLAAGMIQQPVRRNRISMEAIMVQTMRKQAMQLARELEEIKRIQGGSSPTLPHQAPEASKGNIWDSFFDTQEEDSLEVKKVPDMDVNVNEVDVPNDPEIHVQLAAILDHLKTLNLSPNSAGKQGDAFNYFIEQGPPDNTGKTYNMTPSQMRKVKRIQREYDVLVKELNRLPKQGELMVRTGIRSDNTLRKYLGMMGLRTFGQG